MSADLLIIVSVKNNALLTAMQEAGIESAAALSRASGVSLHRVHDYLNLKIAPIGKDGEWRACVLAISKLLRRLPEDLFPAQFLRRALASNRVTREVSAADLPMLMGEATGSIAYDPERAVAVGAALGALDAAMANLRPREARVLQMYFGLDGEAPRTLEAIGRSFNVSKERVRQTIHHAQRKLAAPRHDLRRRCAPLLEDTAVGEDR
ncbi:sigma factor-like helix-turn-helix DNA-binding protein [Falsiroseomonas oryzae]|uniref:sigma factor-like helix-turn-helix DNA-binding protein n=1 Tax=Falsiroseomonas oryzae TaxID=2766473 RepID=UPI0022EAB568|nr:sigma factor-like helix-turn-helix DNA-binding protein [Roseomonas sp. MO-31]